MSLSQDPTSPTTDGAPDTDGGDVHHQPVFWIHGAGLVLVAVGLFILGGQVNPPTSGTWPWVKTGVFLSALGFFAMATIPGALAMMPHPWGTAYRVAAEQRFVHPRLATVTSMLAGLILGGSLVPFLFAPYPFSSPPDWQWLPAWGLAALAACVVALASLLAVYLVDRRR